MDSRVYRLIIANIVVALFAIPGLVSASPDPSPQPSLMPVFSSAPLPGYDNGTGCSGKWTFPTYDKLKQRFNPRGLGHVSLRLGVSAKGEVEKVVVDDGDPSSQYVRDAIEFVQSVHFDPATCNGRPVPGLAHNSFRTQGKPP
jgi:hypothetical protein